MCWTLGKSRPSCFQEDAHVAQLNFDGKEDVAFFGVFDGHGGAQVAKFCAMNMPDELLQSPKYKEGDIGEALKQAYLGIDERLRSKDNLELLNQLREKTTSSGNNGIGVVEPLEQDPSSGVSQSGLETEEQHSTKSRDKLDTTECGSTRIRI